MSNVKEVKAMMAECAKAFEYDNGDSRLYEAKLWYLTGIINGIIRAREESLTPGEMEELLAHMRALLKED